MATYAPPPTNNSAGRFLYWLNGQTSGNLEKLDTWYNTLVPIVAVSGGPSALAVAPNQLEAYVVQASSSSVAKIDLLTAAVLATVSTSSIPAPSIAVHPSGAYVYVPSGGYLLVIDTATFTATSIAVGFSAESVVVHPNGTTAYVSSQTSESISVIDLANNTVATTIAISGAVGLALDQLGTYLYAANVLTAVNVIDTATNTVVETISVSISAPSFVTSTPSGAYLFVSSRNYPNISVISTSSWSEIAVITTTTWTYGLVTNPDGSYIYCTNTGDIISVQELSIVGSFQSGLYNTALAFPGVANGGVGSQISLAGAQVSGGTLSGVIAGLVALGLFSS